MGKNGKSTKSPIFNFLINGRILFSVLRQANKKVRGWITYGRPIAFPTPNFLIGLSWRKLAFYAPLPHFEGEAVPASLDP